jgi:hypothetical protein
MGSWCLRGVPVPAVSMGEGRRYKSIWAVDVEDLSIKDAIKLLLVLTTCCLSLCFPRMSEPLSVRHWGERLVDDKASEFIGSGRKPGASVRK